MAIRHYANQFQVYLPWVNVWLVLCLHSVLNVKVLVGAFNQEKALLRDYEPLCGPSFEALPSAAGGGVQVAGVQPQLEAVLVTLLPAAVTSPPQQGPAPRPHPRHRGVILGLGVGVAAQPATTTSVDTVILNANNNH